MSSADVPVGCRVGLPARARVQIAWPPPAYPVWRLRYRVREFTDRHFAPEACSSGIALKTEPFFRSLFSPGPPGALANLRIISETTSVGFYWELFRG